MHDPESLLIVLQRQGEEPRGRQAIGGRQALLFAIEMLIACDELRPGDQLNVIPE
jgi:hypothetical protein